MIELLRIYEPDECEPNGYPAAWSCCPDCEGSGTITVDNCGNPDTETCESCRGAGSIKDLVREQTMERLDELLALERVPV